MIEKQELHCHNCNKYVQFEIDMELNGNHVLTCPSCGHEHCRVVKDGKITGDRWDSRNQESYIVNSNTITTTSNSTYSNYIITSNNLMGTGTNFLYYSWMNSTTF